MTTPRLIPLLALLLSFTAVTQAATSNPPRETSLTGDVERYIAIDNVCAWPNLTVLRDGTITAAIFNRPSHGQEEGAVEVWASPDGRFWKKRGVPAPHEPFSNRMNVAAGRTQNGDLLVLCSGWSNVQRPGRPKQSPFRDAILPAWICRSSDGGLTWSQDKNFVSGYETDGWQPFIPFGDILPGADGALHASCYQRKGNERRTWHFRSDDDGKTWRAPTLISGKHNETSIFHLGGKKWLAAARYNPDRAMDLFRSNDDGATWEGPQRVTGLNELNAHLSRLRDGRVLLSYGNRDDGRFGVLAKLSSDEGRTWSTPIRLADSLARDCGYPSSVQRPDGKIVTAHYTASAPNHTRYHMGVVIWTAPAP